MKTRILFLFLFVSTLAQAQWQLVNNNFSYRRLKADSTFIIPHGTSPALNAYGIIGMSAGALYFNTLDSSLYTYTGYNWIKVGADLSNYYTKTNLQTSGQAVVDWGNIANKPSTSIPTLQQVTDAGNITTNSIATNSVFADVAIGVRQGVGQRATLTKDGNGSGQLMLENGMNPGHPTFIKPQAATSVSQTLYTPFTGNAVDTLATKADLRGGGGASDNTTIQTLTYGATTTWDASVSVEATVSLTGNTTLSITNLPTDGKAHYLTIRIVQDATGGRTVTWPSSVKWPGGTAPTLTTTGSKEDLITFRWNGTNLYGAYKLNY